MNNAIISLMVAAVSFLFGAVLTRWWNRARPLVLLRGFTNIIKNRDNIDSSEEVEQLTAESWETPELTAEKVSLQQLQTTQVGTKIVLDWYGESAGKIDALVEALQEASSDEELRAVLHEHITDASFERPLALALKRAEIRLKKKDYADAQVKLPIHESKDDKGCYQIVWKSSTSTFSSNLEDQAFLKPRLEPFVDAMRHFDVPVLVDVLTKLKPLLARQIEIHERLKEIVDPIMDESGRWAGRLLVANYGAAPMMIWPSARVVVRHKDSKAKFSVDSYVAVEFDESPKLRDIDGVHVLAPGEKAWIWCITRDIQKDIPNGKSIRTHYVEKDASTYMHLTISRRGAFFGKDIKSNEIVFEDSEVRVP